MGMRQIQGWGGYQVWVCEKYRVWGSSRCVWCVSTHWLRASHSHFSVGSNLGQNKETPLPGQTIVIVIGCVLESPIQVLGILLY